VPGRGDTLALACKARNFIKRDRNFADKEGALDRIEIVVRAREFILDRRAENSRRLQRVKELLPLLPDRELST